MSINNLLNSNRLIALASTAAGNTTLTSQIINMQGYESVLFNVLLGTLTTGQTKGVIQVNAGNASNGSDQAPLAGATITINDTDAGLMECIEVVRPTGFQYVTLTITRNTQAVQILGVVAEQFGQHKDPIPFPDTTFNTVAQALVSVDPEYSNTQLTVVQSTYGNSTVQISNTYRSSS